MCTGVTLGVLVSVTIDTPRTGGCLWVLITEVVLVYVTIYSRTDTCVQVLLWVC